MYEDYDILHGWGESFDEACNRLKEQVTRLLVFGWEPIGSVAITINRDSRGKVRSVGLAQAIVKRKV